MLPHLDLNGYIHRQNLTDLAVLDVRERLQRIKRAYDAYYYGGPDTLKVRKGEINDNVKMNYARLIVDAGVANLFGGEVRVLATPDNAQQVQPVIDAMLDANGGGLLWQRMGTSGAIGGTMFYRLMFHKDTVRVVVLDPATVEISWADDDHETVEGYAITFVPNGGYEARVRRLLVEPMDGEWHVYEQEANEEGEWLNVDDEHWPYPFPPVGHCQNLPSPHEAYGIADLEPDVLDLCDGINRTMSNINRIVRLYAHPRTVGKMIGDALNMNANPGAVIRLEHPDAALYNLEMSSDLSSSIEMYRRLVAALHETTRIPEVATGKLDSAGNLSSLALRILYAPLLQKTESKRRTYGRAIEEVMERALAMMDIDDTVEVKWPDLLPSDPEAMRRTAVLDAQVGVSRASILRNLGYDPDTEAKNLRDEAAEQQSAFDAGL
jgi:hypothetical protein